MGDRQRLAGLYPLTLAYVQTGSSSEACLASGMTGITEGESAETTWLQTDPHADAEDAWRHDGRGTQEALHLHAAAILERDRRAADGGGL